MTGPTAMHDVRLLLWLRVRHARSTLNRMLHFAGASLDDRGPAGRAYLLYLLAIVGVWFVLMWAALLDAVTTAFALAGAEVAVLAVCYALAAPAAVLFAVGSSALRNSPLKLSHPDIAHLAASSVDARALVGVAASAQALAAALVAFGGGYLAGAGARAAGLAVSPAAVAIVLALLVSVAVALGWLAGIVRLSHGRWRARHTALAVAVLAGAAGLWGLLALGVGAAASADPSALAATACGAAIAGVGTAFAVALIAPRIDMTAVIEENALFADLCRFDAFSPLDQDTVREYRRRCKLAARPVRFSLPRGQGHWALVSHAVVSHLRRYDGFPSLLIHGAVVVPLGVLAIMGGGGPALFLFWLMALVMFPQGVREATRAFRDDVHNRLVRDRLPFSVLGLLVFDALPAFALTALVSCVATAALVPTGASLPAALALAVLVNAATMLSCGLDAVRLFSGGPRACYEYGALALAGTSFALALFASVQFVVAGVAFVALAVALVVRFGAECAQ